MKHLFLMMLSFISFFIQTAESNYRSKPVTQESTLTKDDHTFIKDRLRRIREIKVVGNGLSKGNTYEEALEIQKKDINSIAVTVIKRFKKRGITFPKPTGAALNWVASLEHQLGYTNNDDIDISGLNKEDVIKYLFNNGLDCATAWWGAQNIGLNVKWGILSQENIDLALSQWPEIDYAGSRVLKLTVTDNNTFNPYLYNRENGPMRAQNAIAVLRKKQIEK